MNTNRLSRQLRPIAIIAILSLASVAIPGEPSDYVVDAIREAKTHNFSAAIESISKAIDADFDSAKSYYRRGCWHFQNGDAAKSLADFDKLLELAPGYDNSLWQRGISCYYVGDFRGGAEQFVKYQSYHDADVENAVWRYFCQRKYASKEECHKAMLPIEGDRRIGMMEIYRMFKGESTPDQVLAEVDKSKTKDAVKKDELMHAHLYLAMYYDSEGDMDKAKEHIDMAVDQFEQGHYMWSVAVMHKKHLTTLMEKAAAKKKEQTVGATNAN